jgi:hypothetical protein
MSRPKTYFGVKVFDPGQIGNQLFHYCVGKILAAMYDLEFDPAPPPLTRQTPLGIV